MNTGCQRWHGIHIVHVFGKDDKLITAQMRDDVVRSCASFQAGSEVREDIVSQFLAVCMADIRKPVDLDHDQRERFSGTAHALHGANQPGLEAASVGKLCHAVVCGEVAESFLAQLALGNIIGEQDDLRRYQAGRYRRTYFDGIGTAILADVHGLETQWREITVCHITA